MAAELLAGIVCKIPFSVPSLRLTVGSINGSIRLFWIVTKTSYGLAMIGSVDRCSGVVKLGATGLWKRAPGIYTKKRGPEILIGKPSGGETLPHF